MDPLIDLSFLDHFETFLEGSNVGKLGAHSDWKFFCNCWENGLRLVNLSVGKDPIFIQHPADSLKTLVKCLILLWDQTI